MKKFSLFLALVLLFCFFISSCSSVVNPDETTNSNMTDITESTTSAPVIVNPKEWITGYYPSAQEESLTVETPSMVLMAIINTKLNGVVNYYSKADGEIYPFCFDPLCDHKNEDKNGKFQLKCIGSLLNSSEFLIVNFALNNHPTYTETSRIFFINDRFYVFFGNTLYSCNEFAGDIRTEFTFGNGDPIKEYYDRWDEYSLGSEIGSTISDGENLFFTRISTEGSVEQYRYDTKSKQLINLSELLKQKTDFEKEQYIFVGFYFEKIFLQKLVLDESGKWVVSGDFESDYEFDNIKESFNVPKSMIFNTLDGVVFNVRNQIEDTNIMFRLNEDGTRTKLATFKFRELAGYLYCTNSSIIVTERLPVVIGKTHTILSGDKDVINYSSGRLIRVDYDTGEKTVILENLSYNVLSVNYYDRINKIAYFYGNYFELQDDGFYEEHMVTLAGKLDDDGKVVGDLEIIK